MRVLLNINIDILWSVITKCIKVPLMGTHFSCENVFAKHFIELFLIFSGAAVQNPGFRETKI